MLYNESLIIKILASLITKPKNGYECHNMPLKVLNISDC